MPNSFASWQCSRMMSGSMRRIRELGANLGQGQVLHIRNSSLWWTMWKKYGLRIAILNLQNFCRFLMHSMVQWAWKKLILKGWDVNWKIRSYLPYLNWFSHYQRPLRGQSLEVGDTIYLRRWLRLLRYLIKFSPIQGNHNDRNRGVGICIWELKIPLFQNKVNNIYLNNWPKWKIRLHWVL